MLASRAVGLDDHRKRIDELDDQILKLLDERANVVSDVARSKRAANLPTYDPERERQVLERLAARAGRFPADAIRAVYREVMSASLALQEPIKVAYLGPEGTFSHAAARQFFGLAASYAEATTFDGVFDAVFAFFENNVHRVRDLLGSLIPSIPVARGSHCACASAIGPLPT